MALFIIQLTDFIKYGFVAPFLVYFLISLIVYVYKLTAAHYYKPFVAPADYVLPAISIIIPVYNEKPEVWARVLQMISAASENLTYEIIVVPNGGAGDDNGEYARQQGYTVINSTEASKRKAIYVGAEAAQYPVSIILVMLGQKQLSTQFPLFWTPTL